MKVNEILTGYSQLDEVAIAPDEANYEILREGKWVRGSFPTSIRIDQPTSGAGQTHAHVFGRRGNELGVVNLDGTASHGTKMVLSQQDAAALTARGFKVPDDRVVEWIVIDMENLREMLFG